MAVVTGMAEDTLSAGHDLVCRICLNDLHASRSAGSGKSPNMEGPSVRVLELVANGKTNLRLTKNRQKRNMQRSRAWLHRDHGE
jgi:hypothetical protein